MAYLYLFCVHQIQKNETSMSVRAGQCSTLLALMSPTKMHFCFFLIVNSLTSFHFWSGPPASLPFFNKVSIYLTLFWNFCQAYLHCKLQLSKLYSSHSISFSPLSFNFPLLFICPISNLFSIMSSFILLVP